MNHGILNPSDLMAPGHMRLSSNWPHYRVRVQGTKYLWGSAGMKNNVSFASPVTLHIHNDSDGQPITLGQTVAGGAQTILGTLQAGEAYSISIENVIGIYATQTEFESTVTCLIR